MTATLAFLFAYAAFAVSAFFWCGRRAWRYDRLSYGTVPVDRGDYRWHVGFAAYCGLVWPVGIPTVAFLSRKPEPINTWRPLAEPTEWADKLDRLFGYVRRPH